MRQTVDRSFENSLSGCLELDLGVQQAGAYMVKLSLDRTRNWFSNDPVSIYPPFSCGIIGSARADWDFSPVPKHMA